MKFPTTLVQKHYHSPLGPIILVASEQALVGAWFDDQDHLPAELQGQSAWLNAPEHPVLRHASRQLKTLVRALLQAYQAGLHGGR